MLEAVFAAVSFVDAASEFGDVFAHVGILPRFEGNAIARPLEAGSPASPLIAGGRGR
jgi:hypothetical protein